MILVEIAITASIMTISTHGTASAEPKHCDKPGWPDCFDVGKAAAIPGTECPSNHSANYCRGWESASGSSNDNGDSSSNFGRGINTGTNWMDICNKISFALVSSCDILVNPDNTLTSAGVHAHDCIQNGALLAGSALLLGTPPTTIVSLLPFAAQMFGCGDVVDFSKLTLGQLKGFGQIFR